jgi:hypothetical protein
MVQSSGRGANAAVSFRQGGYDEEDMDHCGFDGCFGRRNGIAGRGVGFSK